MPDKPNGHVPDAIDMAIAATPKPRHILRCELANGRVAEMAVPEDLTETEALQILGALPAWILAAIAEHKRTTLGGQLVLVGGGGGSPPPVS